MYSRLIIQKWVSHVNARCYNITIRGTIQFAHTYISVYSKQPATMPVPELQKPAPAFSGTAVVNGQFKDINLSDYKGKYVVLFFYPLDL